MAKATKTSHQTVKPNKQMADEGKKSISHFANFQINTEQGQIEATQGLWSGLCTGIVEPDMASKLLTTLGRVLTRESIKVKAGVYKMAGTRRGFFLSA